jgi:hypothetical protein
VPDALGELIEEHHRKVLLQRRSRKLLPSVALDGRLHPSQFGDALLQRRDAALNVLPRLQPQRVIRRIVPRERGADAHKFVGENDALGKSEPAQRLHEHLAARVKMHELLPVGAFLILQPARAAQRVENGSRLLPRAERGGSRVAFVEGHIRVRLDGFFDESHGIVALDPLHPPCRHPFKRIQCVDV